MNVRYAHQLHQELSDNRSEMPLVYLQEVYPNPNIIISKGSTGVVSRYKDNKWDLSPYSPSPNKEPIFDFVRVLMIDGDISELESEVIEEMKHFLLVLLYVNRGGRFGCISVSTFRKYFYSLAKMGRFCISVNGKGNLHVLTLRDLLSRAQSFSLFANVNPDALTSRNMIDTFNSFRSVSEKHLGFKVIDVKFEEQIARQHNQHPVIPADLYLNLVNGLSEEIGRIGCLTARLTQLIAEFEDKAVGRSHYVQKHLGISKKEYRLSVTKLLKKHRLHKLFAEHYKVTDLATLITALYKIQYVCLHTIILYTGMRITEALNLPVDCIGDEVLSPSILNEDDSVAVESEVIDLISYTTKFTGVKETANWLANSDVRKAVDILKAINCGFSMAERKDFSDTLFVSPNHLKGKSRIRTVFKPCRHQPQWYNSLIIRQEDLDLLRATNPEDQLRDETFVLGNPWPLSAHQFRRSLAFYAANSGFVSLPTLTVQFKHLASGMTKYYCRNYESISSIFGYFDPDTNSFQLPTAHTLFDFKEARVAVVVDSLVRDVIYTETPLYGKSSNYVQRQRRDIEHADDPVNLLDVRRKTKEAVARGEIYYRETLLGGCTSPQDCDCRMLGEFTSCLSNACAVIKPQNVSEQIAELSRYIKYLDPGTGEYQVVEEELRELVAFQEREKRRLL